MVQDDKKQLSTVLNRLKESQLSVLVQALEDHVVTGDQGECVQVPGDSCAPRLLCQVIRSWSGEQESVKLPSCDYHEYNDGDSLFTCCNPYHWSRVISPGQSTLSL